MYEESFIGTLQLFAFGYAPYDGNGWMLCAGQTLQVAQYQALFTLLGANYGGNGSTTFALPDFTKAGYYPGAYAQWYIATSGIYPTRS